MIYIAYVNKYYIDTRIYYIYIKYIYKYIILCAYASLRVRVMEGRMSARVYMRYDPVFSAGSFLRIYSRRDDRGGRIHASRLKSILRRAATSLGSFAAGTLCM